MLFNDGTKRSFVQRRTEYSALPDDLVTLAGQGWRLLPVRARSKQPLLDSWPTEASCDLPRIQEWSETYSGCNWGTLLGDGVFVLDIDPAGLPWLAQQLETHGEAWSATRTVRTGRGGKHFYFACEQTLHSSASVIAPGVDLKAWRSQVLIPPSIHPNGNPYNWETSLDHPIAAAPEWVLELIHAAAKTPPPPVNGHGSAGVIAVGQRHHALTRVAGMLRRVGLDSETLSRTLQAVNNTACAEPSPRDEVERIASDIAEKPLPEPISESPDIPDSVPQWPAATLDGDYIGELAQQLTTGTAVPIQYAREEIVLVLAALADGLLGFPQHADIPIRRYLALISEHPQGGKGESWKRVTNSLLTLFGRVSVRAGSGIGSGQYLAKVLEDCPRQIISWDEASQLFQVSGQQGNTLFSALKSLYEGNSHWTGSLTHKRYGTDDAHLSVLIQCTRPTLESGFATRQAVGDGLLSRFTLCYAEPPSAIPEWEPRNLEAEGALIEKIEQLIPTHFTVPIITGDARECLGAFAIKTNDPTFEQYSHSRRLLELVKIDALHRCIYSGGMEITQDMVSRAIVWGEHQLALRQQFWPSDAKNDIAAMTLRLLNRLRKGTASTNDLRRAANADRDGTHELFNRCLNALTRSNTIGVIGKNRKNRPLYGIED